MQKELNGNNLINDELKDKTNKKNVEIEKNETTMKFNFFFMDKSFNKRVNKKADSRSNQFFICRLTTHLVALLVK